MSPKTGIDELLIDLALRPDVLRCLTESPEACLAEYELTDEQRDLLRNPDRRLLRLLGEALGRQKARCPAFAAETQPHAVMRAQSLPDMNLALTVVPCAQMEEGQFKGFAYGVWVNPLVDGVNPANLPPPAGSILPGQPLTPLYAVIRLSAVQFADASGHAQVGLWASLRQATNVDSPVEAAGPAPDVTAEVAAVRGATPGERYDKLIDLIEALQNG